MGRGEGRIGLSPSHPGQRAHAILELWTKANITQANMSRAHRNSTVWRELTYQPAAIVYTIRVPSNVAPLNSMETLSNDALGIVVSALHSFPRFNQTGTGILLKIDYCFCLEHTCIAISYYLPWTMKINNCLHSIYVLLCLISNGRAI